jgi:3,4-dihydroxy 2-butanone 4-phosphate synthase / GTP cyclohydrolase II
MMNRSTITIVTRVSRARVPTIHGELTAIAYQADGHEHVAFVMGQVARRAGVLARVHSECLTGDLFGSLRCDCGSQLTGALERIAAEGRGVIVYLRGHEGRGIGIAKKLAAYGLQDSGRDTVEANVELGLPVDARTYDVGAAILADLGVRSVRLLTNNPRKPAALERCGIRVVERVPLETSTNPHNRRYLEAKRDKLGHLLDLPDPVLPGAEPTGP